MILSLDDLLRPTNDGLLTIIAKSLLRLNLDGLLILSLDDPLIPTNDGRWSTGQTGADDPLRLSLDSVLHSHDDLLRPTNNSLLRLSSDGLMIRKITTVGLWRLTNLT